MVAVQVFDYPCQMVWKLVVLQDVVQSFMCDAVEGHVNVVREYCQSYGR